jgi:protein TonB
MSEAVGNWITGERGDTGFAHWGIGIVFAAGLHVGVALMALSSGAGLSLAPEGGGGTGGGMTVLMGSGGSGNDQMDEVAAAMVVAEPEPVVEIEPPKPEPELIPEVKKIPTQKPKPKPKVEAKPKPKAKPVVKQVVQRDVATVGDASVQGAVDGRVGGKGQVNRQAGGGPVGPSVGAGNSAGFGIDTAYKSYNREVRRLLLRHKQYPRTAQRLGQQGRVVLAITIAPSGKVLRSNVVEKCQYPILNREVTKLVRRIRQFPPIPPKVSTSPITFTVAIPFVLR